MKTGLIRTQYSKSLLASSIFLLGITAFNTNAAPIADIPHYNKIRDKIPSTVTDFTEAASWQALYGTSSTNALYIPDNFTAAGTSMPGTIYIDSRNYQRAVVIVGDDVTVTQSASGVDGIRTNGGTPTAQGTIIAGDRLTIHVTGADSDGINAGYWTGSLSIPTYGSNNIYVGDHLNIVTEGNEGRGISVYQLSGFYSNTNEVTLGDYAEITTKGDRSEGIRAGGNTLGTINNSVKTGNNTTIITEGNASYALRADNASIVTGNSTRIITEKDGSHGVYTTGSRGNITLGSNANITTNGTNNTYNVYAASGATVNLLGGATIANAGSQASNSYALFATGNNSHIDGSSAGIYRITGDINATTGGTIDLNMATGSTWKGAAYLASNGASNLTMANSTWDMTGNSQITSLDTQNSRVNFQSSAGNFLTLTTGSLAGSGNFAMNVNMESLQGDLLRVTDTNVTGNHVLTIANVGSANTTGNEVLTVVETLDHNQGSFTSNTVEAGGYEYQLRQSASSTTGWELSSGGRRTTSAEASVNVFTTNYLLSYIDNQTLLQRMGQLRSTDDHQGDFWIRSFAGKLDSFGGNVVSGFDMNYKGTQAGIDKLIKTDNGRLYVGGMVGFTDADPNYRGGNGTTKDYHLGLYSSYINDDGLYIDGVLKYTRMQNRFNVKDTLGNTITGKGNSAGYSVSVEAGKRFYFSGLKQAGGYYIEPQGQITYGHQGGMNINGSNGLKTNLSNYNYTLGRASAIVGYTIEGANPVDIYLKTGYVREFDGNTSFTFNHGKKTNHSFKGGWWDNGIGVNAQLKGRHNIYADINYATGSNFDQKQLNLGYRYSF